MNCAHSWFPKPVLQIHVTSSFVLGTEALFSEEQKNFVEVFFFCFMYVSMVFLLGTEVHFNSIFKKFKEPSLDQSEFSSYLIQTISWISVRCHPDDIDVIDNIDDVENNNKMRCYECNAIHAM